jgi:hypothetical protein
MGSQSSKELNFRDNSLLSFDSDELEYNGIKSSEESLEENENIFCGKEDMTSSELEKDTLLNDNIKLNDQNKIPVTFEWESEGNSVYLSGSFCNWEQFFLMEKQPNGKRILTLYLNKGFIQYKFKVDNIWRCNEKFPITDDNGNKNNYIDTTNWEISVGKSDETTTNTEASFKQIDNKSINLSLELQNAQKNYTNYIPKLNELNVNAPKTPEQYIKNIDLNNNSSEEEKCDFYKESYDYKSIKSVFHEQINHMNYKIKNNKIVNNSGDKNSVVCSIVSRYRLKFTTFVYYNKE